jgi:hypothetical protein
MHRRAFLALAALLPWLRTKGTNPNIVCMADYAHATIDCTGRLFINCTFDRCKLDNSAKARGFHGCVFHSTPALFHFGRLA